MAWLGVAWTATKSVLGFTSEPAKWWGIAAIGLLLVTIVTTFFMAYSVRRHKQIIARLQSNAIRQEAEIKSRDLGLQRKDVELKLALLRKDEANEQAKRQALRKSLQVLDTKFSKFEPTLSKARQKGKQEDLGKLLKETDLILKEIF